MGFHGGNGRSHHLDVAGMDVAGANGPNPDPRNLERQPSTAVAVAGTGQRDTAGGLIHAVLVLRRKRAGGCRLGRGAFGAVLPRGGLFIAGVVETGGTLWRKASVAGG